MSVISQTDIYTMCVSSNRRDFIYDVYIPVYHTDKFNAFISLTMRMSDFAPPNIQ